MRYIFRITMIYDYIHSFSHSELVNISYASIYTFVAGILTLLCVNAYLDKMDKDKDKEIEEQTTTVYGTKETCVTIQHTVPLALQQEAFLRHIRALSTVDSESKEVFEILHNLCKLMECDISSKYT